MSRGQSEGRPRANRSRVLDSRPEYERLGAWLRTQRTKSGQIQQPIADKIGKPRQFITKVEQGQQRIDVVEFLDLYRALRLDPSVTVAELIAVLEGAA